MYDKFYVGLKVTDFEKNGVHRPVSKITLKKDSSHSVSAGDSSGLELEADCPYATQAMADSILAAVKGKQYKMYRASNAQIDPAVELGDGVTVCGLYSVIARIEDDGYWYPDLSAPGEAEQEYRYPYESYMKRRLDNIEAKVEEITGELEEVSGKINDFLDGSGYVISFNGRDGEVVPLEEDYKEFIDAAIRKAIYASWEAAY